MVFILLLVVLILSLLLSKFLFKKWFNHLSIYTVIWFFLLTFYELKLFHYYDLSAKTWFVIISAFGSFILGILTFFAARQPVNSFESRIEKPTLVESPLFNSDCTVLKNAVIITGLIGLAAVIQHWMILFHTFGSLKNIIIYSNIIYQLRVEGEIVPIPYIFAFAYVSVFLASIYLGIKNKFSFLVLLPFSAIILKDIANVGRAGMLFALVEFLSGLMLVRYAKIISNRKKTKVNNKKLAFGLLIIIVLFIASATTVKNLRAPIEQFKGATSTVNKLKGRIVITPSIYLYFSAHVGVLNKYLKLDNENPMFGENTFMPFYRVLHKFNVVRKPQFYSKGYYIPMWVNTGTYLRDLYSDFGVSGILIIPYLLGLLATVFWFKFFYYHKIIYLVCLVYIYIIIFFSFLMYAVRLGNWLIGLIALLVLVPLLEKISSYRTKKSLLLPNE